MDRGASTDEDVHFVAGRDPGISMSSVYRPGGRPGNRRSPFSLVVIVVAPPINAGELIRSRAPATTPPCSSVTVPMRVPVRPWAAAIRGGRIVAAARINKSQDRERGCGWSSGDVHVTLSVNRMAALDGGRERSEMLSRLLSKKREGSAKT